ncbi:MAG: arginine--tRNA ligase [Dehalococcoidia bacterium]|nr:arginine--tRNA ligase [Dehalococcoidia bacterium]
MIKNKIIELLEKAAAEAQAQGLLPPVTLPEITLEHPPNERFGDYASSLPLRLERAVHMKPLDIAKILVRLLPATEEIEKVSVAPPGFINFVLKNSWLGCQVDCVLAEGSGYGNQELSKGSSVQVEYVSVNPTGPLHVGHGRGAILGSTLSKVLDAAGYAVTKEYYVNNAGTQMQVFYHSLYARYLQALGREAELPANGYQGEYVKEIAQQIIAETGDKFLRMPAEQAVAEVGNIGLQKVVAAIRADLDLMCVDFDVWFSEQSLFDGGQYQKAMSLLAERGYTAVKEGATWFASTALGEDKDNVLVRSNGAPTYFASDVAYHYNKFVERKFDRVINIWGADHQGHVSRMKAVVSALGIDPSRLQIIIGQMVSLKRGDVLVKASKRKGEIVTLRELVEEVGPDVCRFFFLSRSADAQMDFDLALAKEQSENNPVYYVQYAHARIASILRLAQEKGIDFSQGDTCLLTHPAELSLIRKILLLPELVESIALNLEPHHLPHYAQDLATSFHSFYKQCRVVSDDEALTPARLKLVQATKIVLARTLDLMGMTAPEKM